LHLTISRDAVAENLHPELAELGYNLATWWKEQRRMLSLSFIPKPCSHRNAALLVQGLAARAIWSRFASPRAELVGAPSLSRPNLFAGD
jgi:hypothetical protein